ncbi:carbohydrate binding family 9 domain-containing protein [Acidobacteria bacterium AH-259-A15]|nr:carbohydrate binding family 9 domain-containing protein [Acidobacteria bacterium AH-259-A15]
MIHKEEVCFPVVLFVLAFSGIPYLCAEKIDFLNIHKEKKVTAVYIEEEAIVLDGGLGEPEWNLAEPAKDFIQSEPLSGEPASESTEVRLLYDRKNIYIGVYCYDSEGKKGIVVNDMARDFYYRNGDTFHVVFDTFDDDRNGFAFGTNPKGARRDLQTGADGFSYNSDWDGVWHVKTKITDSGWQAEFAIPFKTLRFRHHESQLWGVNFSRGIRRKNEQSYWSAIPPPFRLYRVSLAGTLDGISGVRQGRNLYVKPYISAPLLRREDDDVDFMPDAGFDVKYGVTSGLTLDLTVNTDFAQVEADEAQINFTRFSLFFPEKREFFLENREIFEFGNVGFRGFSGRSSRSGLFRPRNDLIPFFSRRIGISEGQLIPILGGARLTGRAGKYRLGIISMQADEFKETPSTNFSVARIRRDVFRNSDIGVLFINKQEGGGRFNRTYGVDANFTFFRYLNVSSYVLNTDTPGIQDKDMAGFFRMAWREALFENKLVVDLEASHISIQENFNAEAGFVPRGGYDVDDQTGEGMRKTNVEIEFRPRPEGSIPWVREFRPTVEVDYITDQENLLETREVQSRVSVMFNNSSYLGFSRRSTFERLTEEDEILDETLPVGDYQFAESSVYYSSDRSRMFSGLFRLASGDFYNGQRDSYTVGGSFSPSAQLGVDVLWSHSDLSFASRDFSTDLVTTRLAYSFTTNMFLNALIQYSSRQGDISSNIRFNLIHKPLSDFFLVYNERRSPTGEIVDRALIAKVTYLFDF